MTRQVMRLAAAVLAAGCAWAAGAAGQAPKPAARPASADLPATPELPADVDAGWTKAGARLLWVGPAERYALSWSYNAPVGLTDPLPGFYLNDVARVKLDALPDPGTPFGVEASTANATPAHVQQLAAFKQLTYFNVTVVSRAKTLPGLGDMQQLRALKVHLPGGTDEFLVGEVSRLTGLRHLGLRAGRYTAKGWAAVGGLAALETLEVQPIPVDSTGLKVVARLTNLKTLVIANDQRDQKGPRLADEAAAAVGTLAGLERLTLYGVGLTDAHVDAIAKLRNLRALTIERDTLSDAAVAKLHALKQLKSVSFSGTRMSAAAVAGLKAAVPGVRLSGAP